MNKQLDLTDEQRQALDDNEGIVEGPTFILMRTDVFRDFLGLGRDENLRQQLQIGFDQANRGQFVDWNPERIRAEGRRRLEGRSTGK